LRHASLTETLSAMRIRGRVKPRIDGGWKLAPAALAKRRSPAAQSTTNIQE
jgi:hypothetical protein